MTDVIVLGGGPAGCVTARRLALSGLRVSLLSSGAVAGREGLSARTCALLVEEGFDPGIGGLSGPVARAGEWGVGRRVVGQEWLVDRERLAAELRAAAAGAGVVVHNELAMDISGTLPDVSVQTRSGRTITATCLVDARGRRGPEIHGPTLVATGRAYRRRTPLPPGTAIHALAWGWCWIVAQGKELWVQIAGRPGDGHPEGWVARAAAELPVLAAALDGAAPAGEALARPAHARRATGVPAMGVFRAGDASVGLDPLSGQGVYEALRSARVTVAAVRSMLDGGDPRPIARFLRERDDALWERVVATAAMFYAENAARGPFWAETAAQYRAIAPPAPPLIPIATIERRPVLDGDRIRQRDVLVTAAQPRGVWRVDGVSVVDLIHYIESAGSVTPGDAAVALARPSAAVVAAARWLRAAGAWPARANPSLFAGG